MKENVRFANVDLEIRSSTNLQPLIDELSTDVAVLHNDLLESGLFFASLGLKEYDAYQGANEIIEAFYGLIKSLSPAAAIIWNESRERIFDIGFESGNDGEALSSRISNRTIEHIAEIGASIGVTIYPFTDTTDAVV